MKHTPAETTLADLQKQAGWVWVCREGTGCGHRAPVAIAPFAIRWGLDASSDLIRDRLRCSKCSRVGVTIQMPSWAGNAIGTQPFPTAWPPLVVPSVSPWDRR
jgi:hypothetical protein